MNRLILLAHRCKAASGAFQAIIAAMPPHDTYIETHLGSGAIMKYKPLAVRSIGIDIDSEATLRFGSMAGVELHQGDAVTFLRQFDYKTAGRVLVYADPPYLHSTRTSRKRYRFEYNEKDHILLLAVLRELTASGVSVMLSGYPSSLYDKLLPDWRTLEFQVMSRGGVRTEKLWLSFAANSAHWATFAGQNFTDRQRIKRKAQRWAENYRTLPAAERVAILAANVKYNKLSSHRRVSAPFDNILNGQINISGVACFALRFRSLS
jgi:DNA adenine methylase